MSNQPKPIKEVKVSITLNDGVDFFGLLYLPEGTRVQDVLNDGRKFLPVNKHMQNRGRGNQDVWVMTVINKDSIKIVEER